MAVVYSPDGKNLVSADDQGRVIVRDPVNGAEKRRWKLPGEVIGLAFAPDNVHLATANANGTIYILRLGARQ